MIVGREKEQKLLEKMFKSKESEFVAVYGRRRVDKTYLIRETFPHQDCDFVYTVGKRKQGHKSNCF